MKKRIGLLIPCCSLAALLFFTRSADARIEDGSDANYWDDKALVIAEVRQPLNAPENTYDLEILRVMTTPAPMPARLSIKLFVIPDVGDGLKFMLLLRKEKDGWHAVYGSPNGGDSLTFMPKAEPFGGFDNAAIVLTGLDDKRIEETEKKVRAAQAKSQEAKIVAAKKVSDKQLAQELGQYREFWSYHALVVAHVAPNGPRRSVLADFHSILFGPQSAPAVNGNISFEWPNDDLKQPGNQGRWVVLLLADSEAGWRVTSKPNIPIPFPAGITELKDDKDPKIEEITKAAQNWLPQILNNAGGKPPAPTTTTAPASAPATSPAGSR